MKFRFPIIIIDEDFRAENISGSGIRDLAEAIETEGMEVIGLTSYGDLTSFAQQASRASTFIVSIDDEEFVSDSEDNDLPALNNLRAFIAEVASVTKIFRSSSMARPALLAICLTIFCASYMVSFI